jgi:Fe-S cluster assembly protein SufD
MTQLTAARDRYLADFEAFERAGRTAEPDWLRALRRSAIERFAELGFPTPRDEDWKYTSLAPLGGCAFRPVLDGAPPEPGLAALAPVALDETTRVVFVDGRYSARLSVTRPLPGGTRLLSLAEAVTTDADRVQEHLGRHADPGRSGFTALNGALARDGLFLYVPPGVRVAEPIHVVQVGRAAGGPTLAQPRHLIVLDRDAGATVIESYVGLGDDAYLTNAVIEIVAGAGSALDHYKIQEESPRAFHLATHRVTQARGSRVALCSVALGARLARNDLHVVLDAEGSECALSGLYVIAAEQHVDHHTVVDHARPRCTSRQLYKGVLDGRSRAVFSGRIIVRPGAQKTDAHQTNKNLLLSDGVEVDSKPQLEIFADDVRCTHGAADGQLAEDALFYLRSRGIGDAAARTLLTYGFASEVLARVGPAPLRARLDALVLARLRRDREAPKETS